MAFYSAKNARVQINGSNLFAMRWTITAKTDDLDVTNFESGGFGIYFGGIMDADITFDAVWDSVQDPFANPPTIQPAAILGNGQTGAGATVKFFLDWINLGVFWSFSGILVTSVTQDTDVRGFIKFSVAAKNATGAYTMPA
jgi:hypothetical protein